MFVVGISGASPKTRAFVTERTWADQTKSAFSDAGAIAAGAFGRNRKGAIDRIGGRRPGWCRNSRAYKKG